MLYQRVNMRAGVPLQCGDAATEDAYLRAVEALRAELLPGQVVVAPGVTIGRTRKGELTTGAVVEAGDLLDLIDASTGQVIEHGPSRLARLLMRGSLIEAW